MYKYAEFVLEKDGTPITVSAKYVVYIRQGAGGTQIALDYTNKENTSVSVTVRESYEFVRQTLGFDLPQIRKGIGA